MLSIMLSNAYMGVCFYAASIQVKGLQQTPCLYFLQHPAGSDYQAIQLYRICVFTAVIGINHG